MKRNCIIEQDLADIVAQDLPWHEFAGRTVLVSGANGFLPAYMVETLLYLNEKHGVNCRVIGLVRNREKAERRFVHLLSRPDFSLLVQDVCSPIALKENVDFVVHAASEASPKYYCKDPAGTLLGGITDRHQRPGPVIRNHSYELLIDLAFSPPTDERAVAHVDADRKLVVSVNVSKRQSAFVVVRRKRPLQG